MRASVEGGLDEHPLACARPMNQREFRASAIVASHASWMIDGELRMHTWEQWQSEIVTLLQKEFGGDALQDISLDDVDWPSWNSFYLQRKSPRAAIERALERDL
jgi:hypothetical protein